MIGPRHGRGLRAKALAWLLVPAVGIVAGVALVAAWVIQPGAQPPVGSTLASWPLAGGLLLVLLGLGAQVLVVARGMDRVARDLTELTQAAEAMARGDFGGTVTVDTGDDEVARLAEQINALSAQAGARIRQMEAQAAELDRRLAATAEGNRRRSEQFRVMTEVGQRMTTLAGVSELLDLIVTLIQQAFGYYHVGIGLVEDDVVTYHAGAGPLWDRPDTAFMPGRLKVGQEGITGLVAGTGQPMLVPDVTREPAYVEMQGSSTRSELVVPIKAKGRVIGVLDVQSATPAAFDESDVQVLQSLANQAAIAIENAQLYEQARDLAVLEERQRVARDLHDSVTQSLYGVTLFADGAARLLAGRQVDAAGDYLEQLRETAREALRQMRLLVFELRPPELETVGLAAAIEARLDAVERRAGVHTELATHGDVRAAPETEAALYRIAQEALNNALKHAHARTVRVELARGEASLRLSIADDGVGFDQDAARAAGGLGLRSMRERAARLGGTLDLESAPGSGTRLTAEVPL